MPGRKAAALVVAILALLATPVLAQQFSDSYSFLKAVRARDGATVDGLLANPSSTVINARDGHGDGALHIVTRARDLTWLSFLLSKGARPDLQAADGATALLIAAQIGWRDGAEALLARGANPNLGNAQGETPLMFAVRRYDMSMVRLLLAHHADPNQTDNLSGNSAIDYARQDRRAAAILNVLERSH